MHGKRTTTTGSTAAMPCCVRTSCSTRTFYIPHSAGLYAWEEDDDDSVNSGNATVMAAAPPRLFVVAYIHYEQLLPLTASMCAPDKPTLALLLPQALHLPPMPLWMLPGGDPARGTSVCAGVYYCVCVMCV